MQFQPTCSADVSATAKMLTDDLLPQTFKYISWSGLPKGMKERFEAWCSALAAEDPGATSQEQLMDVLRIARCIVYAQLRVSPGQGAYGGPAGHDVEFSGGGAAVVALEMRKHVQSLVVASLGDAGLDLLAEDERAEEELLARVRLLMQQRIDAFH